LFFELAHDRVGGLPRVGEGAFAGRVGGVIPDELQKLLQRRAADQIQTPLRILITGRRCAHVNGRIGSHGDGSGGAGDDVR